MSDENSLQRIFTTQDGMTAIFAYWLKSSERESYAHKAFFAPMSKVPFFWITGWYRDTGWMQAAMDMDHQLHI
jgi:hypothetical protein